jgi:hypothetical protein
MNKLIYSLLGVCGVIGIVYYTVMINPIPAMAVCIVGVIVLLIENLYRLKHK